LLYPLLCNVGFSYTLGDNRFKEEKWEGINEGEEGKATEREFLIIWFTRRNEFLHMLG